METGTGSALERLGGKARGCEGRGRDAERDDRPGGEGGIALERGDRRRLRMEVSFVEPERFIRQTWGEGFG